MRHLAMLAMSFGRVCAVDTRLQLNRRQRLYGSGGRIREVGRILREGWAPVRTLSAEAFDRSRLSADAILSVCVYQAVPPWTRGRLAAAAFRNLRPGGTYVVIVPRNDSTVLRRCGPSNAAEDGYVFARHGALTFFRNFRSVDPLKQLLSDAGFRLVHDGSRYRHIWLVVERPSTAASGRSQT